MVIPYNYKFYFVFHDLIVLLQRLVLCHLVMTFYLSLYVLFMYGKFRQKRAYLIKKKTINHIMVIIRMLKNWSYRYSYYQIYRI